MPSRVVAEMPSVFWKWYDGRRQEFDLSDSGVALKAQISHSVISKARNGERPIGFEALSKIAQALDTPVVSVLALAGAIGKEEIPSPSAVEFADLFERMTEEDQEEILALVRLKSKRRKKQQVTEG